ncbi:MAG TPA: cytidylate kinase-like family protein [Acidimicrobiales bacterium]|nr:cytidylate kinase-like family protein [Acidimicrobiales bacterium]
MNRVVTMSGSYGAGGSVIGPAVARHLGVPFLDRAVPARVSTGGPLSTEEAAVEERTPNLIERIVATFARLPNAFGPGVPTPEDGFVQEEDLRRETESRVRAFVERHGSGVILGWGATVILPEAFHVRLDGPPERRIQRAMEIQGIDRDEGQRRQGDTDRVRSQYMRRLHGKDWNDLRLYHLVLDTTAMSLETASQLVAQAAISYFAESPLTIRSP